MRKLAIDFAPSSWRSRQPPLLLGALAVLFLSAAIAFAWAFSLKLNAERLQDERQRGREQQALATQAANQAMALDKAQLLAVNTAIRKLNMPWRDMFEVVERTASDGIAILAIEPSAERGFILISAEAKSAADMMAYLQVMRRQPELAQVDLLRHSTNEQDPSRPLRFSLAAAWLGLPVVAGGSR